MCTVHNLENFRVEMVHTQLKHILWKIYSLQQQHVIPPHPGVPLHYRTTGYIKLSWPLIFIL